VQKKIQPSSFMQLACSLPGPVVCELLQIVHHEVAAVFRGEHVCGSKAISIELEQPFKRQKYVCGTDRRS
jgi:hypothetical protein